MGTLEGKVAFITGAARGQGRSHAVRLAREGADIIAVDLCAQLDTVAYPMATPDDLRETVAQVEALDRRIHAVRADVRDLGALTTAVADGQAQLGPIDIIIANAGIAAFGETGATDEQTFRDVIDINLVGVWNTVTAAVPSLIEKGAGSVVLTSSTQGLKGTGGNGDPGGSAYAAAKHGVVGLMRTFTNWLGPLGIRVNSIHPTGVNTPMIVNDVMAAMFADPTAMNDAVSNLMPVPMVEAIDVSNAIAWLVSDEARYVTGVTLPVDAGFNAK
ncbi:mycofactocin-coupled SDR family oxidoreductase [Cryptosporangium phraense]|uniref:NAD(P)-dependent oxidoreductase n=1 Tax=Cryptosporangium phraense TaxID=2593070 RepID=A0A545ARV2_9ACTN|nr:mycofactocin-coupled SDR family oxidoreductase [Cryptosporangium phraense]TQS43981.1 NAD(P)-dependent oxidoreductase [Cryptosporangium phraense]